MRKNSLAPFLMKAAPELNENEIKIVVGKIYKAFAKRRIPKWSVLEVDVQNDVYIVSTFYGTLEFSKDFQEVEQKNSRYKKIRRQEFNRSYFAKFVI